MLKNNEMALHTMFCIIVFRQIQSKSALDRYDGSPPIRVSAFGAISDPAFLCFAPPLIKQRPSVTSICVKQPLQPSITLHF